MKVLIVNHDEVGQWLPMTECIDVMADVFKMLNSDKALNPLRHTMWLPDKTGVIAMMPAYLQDYAVMGLKAISVFPGNLATEYESHQGAVMLFEIQNGRLLAMLDASLITAIRTAAVSGLATRLLAREDTSKLAILGSGVQATAHLEAMLAVRQFTEVKVWSRTLEHAQTFARHAADRYNQPVGATQTAGEAVEGADVICTVTSATDPVLHGVWLEAGMHINAVGSSVPVTRELDTEAVVKSRLFVDRRESAVNEAGDFLFPLKEKAVTEAHIQGEIGDILLDNIRGRESQTDITLFKSLGLAVEDVAAALHIYQKMTAQNQGTRVEFNGTKG